MYTCPTMPNEQGLSSSTTIQKLGIPIAIVIAGALIAGAIFFGGGTGGGGNTPPVGQVVEKIRGVQGDDHIVGNRNAKVVIVEFSDTECPFCKVFHETLHRIVSEYEPSEVAWVFRHWPIPQLHPKAPKEAEALECAAAQGGPSSSLGTSNDVFWKYTDKVFEATGSNNALDIGVYNSPSPTPKGADGKSYYTEKKPRSTTDAGQLSDIAVSLGLDKAAFEQCLASGTYSDRIATDVAEVGAAGGQGTPHSIMIVGKNQTPIEGAQSYESVKQMIDAAL